MTLSLSLWLKGMGDSVENGLQQLVKTCPGAQQLVAKGMVFFFFTAARQNVSWRSQLVAKGMVLEKEREREREGGREGEREREYVYVLCIYVHTFSALIIHPFCPRQLITS
jgi:hypothetical protein